VTIDGIRTSITDSLNVGTFPCSVGRQGKTELSGHNEGDNQSRHSDWTNCCMKCHWKPERRNTQRPRKDSSGLDFGEVLLLL
jgi:hypothetical protein